MKKLGGILVLTLLALAVRLGAEPVAWSGYTLDFLHFATGIDPHLDPNYSFWTTRIGLHPPQFALLVRGLVHLGVSVGGLVLIYSALSAGIVGYGGRLFHKNGAPVGALFFGVIAALSPLQAYFSWHISNYVLLALLGFAWFGMLWDVARDPTGPTKWLLPVLAVLVTHLHVLGMALVGLSLLPLLFWRRRVESLGTLVALAATTPVILPLAKHLLSYRDSDGAAARVSPGYEGLPGMLHAYGEQFGDPLTLGSLVLLTLLSAALVLGSKQRGDRFVLLATATVLGLTGLAMLAGLSNPRQGQYWVLGGVIHAALLGLAFDRAGRRLRIVMAILLLPWVLSAGSQALNKHLQFLPEVSLEQRAEYWLIETDSGLRIGTPFHHPSLSTEEVPLTSGLRSEIHRELRAVAKQADLILYVDESWWVSDHPRRVDPIFAAFDPSEVDATLPQAPKPGAPSPTGYPYPWRWNDIPLQVVTSGPRDPDQARSGPLRDELNKQLSAGRTVLVALAAIDPTDRPILVSELVEDAAVRVDKTIGPSRFVLVGPSTEKAPGAAEESPEDPGMQQDHSAGTEAQQDKVTGNAEAGDSGGETQEVEGPGTAPIGTD